MASLVAGEAAIALPMDFAVEGEAALIQIGGGFRGWQGLSVILAGSKENIKKKNRQCRQSHIAQLVSTFDFLARQIGIGTQVIDFSNL